MCHSARTECMDKCLYQCLACLYEAAFGSSVWYLLVVLKMPAVAGVGKLFCRKLHYTGIGTGHAGISVSLEVNL